MPHYVYIVSGETRVKIGMSKSPEKRLAQLRTASAVPLNLVATVPCDWRRSARDLERYLHLRLHEFRECGEWFAKRVLDELDIEALRQRAKHFDKVHTRRLPMLRKAQREEEARLKDKEERKRKNSAAFEAAIAAARAKNGALQPPVYKKAEPAWWIALPS